MTIFQNSPVPQVTTTLRWSAGFGSNFLQAIDWYWYSKTTGTPIYVDWNYNGYNYFNNFFIQKYIKDPQSVITNAYYHSSPLLNKEIIDLRYIDLPLYKKYDHLFFGKGDLYKEPTFNDITIFFNKLFKENLTLIPPPGITPELFANTLGIHSRYIGHYYADNKYTVPLHSIISEQEYYAKNLEQIKVKFESGGYRNIFLGCDDITFVDMCIKEFKDKVVYQNYKRTVYHNWENRCPNKGYNSQGLAERLPVDMEFANALIDIVALSMCKDFLGSVSSFTFSVLVFNPFKNFELFKTTEGVSTG